MNKKLLKENEEKFHKQILPIKGLNEKEIKKFINGPNGKLMALPKNTWEDKFKDIPLNKKNPFMVEISNTIIHIRRAKIGTTPKGYTFAGKLLKVQECYLLKLGRRAKGVAKGVIVE